MHIACAIALLLPGQTARAGAGEQPAVSVSLDSTRLVGGGAVNGHIALSTPAPAGGLVVGLASSDPSVSILNLANLAVVQNVVVPAGQARSDFGVRVNVVAAQVRVMLTASSTRGSATVTLTVLPPTATRVVLQSDSVIGGAVTQATVTLDGPAPSAGLTINITSNSASATVPTTVSVASGQRTAVFPVTALAVPKPVTVAITAGSIAASLRILPPTLQSFTVRTTSVTGGTALEGVVSLNGRAPAGGITVSFTTSTPAVDARRTVTIAENSSGAQVTLATIAVNTITAVTVTAVSGDGKTRIAESVTLLPPAVSTLALAPTTMAGQATVTATVTLSHPAPSGGMPVAISRTTAASQFVRIELPATVLVPAGERSATFSAQVTADDGTSGSEGLRTSTSSGGATASLTVVPLRITNIAVSKPVALGGDTVVLVVTRNGIPSTPLAQYPLRFEPANAVLSPVILYSTGASTTGTAAVVVNLVNAATPVTIGDGTRTVGTIAIRSHRAVRLDVRRRVNGVVEPALVDSVESNDDVEITMHLERRSYGTPATPPFSKIIRAEDPLTSTPNALQRNVTLGDSLVTFIRRVPAKLVPTEWRLEATDLALSFELARTVGIKRAPITSVTLFSATAASNQSVAGTVTLGVSGTHVGPNGLAVPLESSLPSVASVPQTVAIPFQNNTGGFTVSTKPVTVPTQVTIKAGGVPGDFNTGVRTTITVTP